MFVWQLVVVTFSLSYRAAREGRKVAYLTVASFLFLVIALVTYVIGHDGPAVARRVGTAHQNRMEAANVFLVGDAHPTLDRKHT